MTPTARSLAECKRRGWTAGVVEKFVRFPPPGHRVDLFGCIDIVAIGPQGEVGMCDDWSERIFGIQACAGASHAARKTKALAEPRLRAWLEAGGRFAIWSWAKRGDRGKRKLWTLRTEQIRVEDFA